MILHCCVVGPLQANCFLVGCPRTREALVIDPGGDPDEILAATSRLQLQVTHLANTHGHVDHVAANHALRQATGASLWIHSADQPMIQQPSPMWAAMVGGVVPSSPDGCYQEGDVLQVGSLQVQVLHTPGHSPGSVCLSVGDELFTGDTLFAGGVGRTDLPGGNWQELTHSLRRLIREFSPHTRIHPGHGPSSTLAEELRTNPWLTDLP